MIQLAYSQHRNNSNNHLMHHTKQWYNSKAPVQLISLRNVPLLRYNVCGKYLKETDILQSAFQNPITFDHAMWEMNRWHASLPNNNLEKQMKQTLNLIEGGI